MKGKIAVFMLMSCCLLSTPSAFAQNDPACEAVVCLAGKIAGQSGGSACNGSINKYFSIVVKKRGKFNPSRTADARNSWLSQCSTDTSGSISRINAKYGRVRGL